MGIFGAALAWGQDSLQPGQIQVDLEGVDIVALRGQVHKVPKHGNQGHVGQQLDLNTGHLVKYNGPVGLASINMWGLGGQHTAISWQGMNLQSTMNGYADLNLMPAFLFDQLALGNGDLGLPLGGGIGGTLSLSGKSGRNEALFGMASFSNANYGLALAPLSAKKTKLQLLAYRSTGQNDFTYTMFGITKQIDHARMEQNHLSAHWEWSPKAHTTLWASIWAMSAFRQLPPTFFETHSEAEQRDRNLRAALGYRVYNPQAPGHKKSIQGTLSQEHITYSDPLKNQVGRNMATSALLHYHHQWAKLLPNAKGQLRMAWGASGGLGHVEALDYTTRGSFPSAALHLQLEKIHAVHLRTWATAAKVEHFAGRTAWAANISSRHVMNQSITVQTFIGKTYRFPTFNDLLWNQGGNPFLQTEKGYKAHMEMDYHWKNGVSIRVQAHTALVQDWIQWVPNNQGIWMAKNVKHVWARGLETTIEKTWKLGSTTLKARGVYALTRTESITPGHKIGFGPQMPYTPYHKAVGLFGFHRQSLEGSFDLQAIGKRYTNSDNSAELRPYLMANLGFGYTWKWIRLKTELLNLFNTQYQSTITYGMPGRNARINLLVDLAGAFGGEKDKGNQSN
jgi:iron complex outermembrane receptor protein